MRPESKWVALPSVRVFDEVDADKAQALKVVEEACEVFGAWQQCEQAPTVAALVPGLDASSYAEMCRDALVSECCDVVQAVCNLLAALGVDDLAEDMRACRRRNQARGRISDGK